MEETADKPIRKSITFDLSTEELEKRFPNTSKPYAQIKKFMIKNGFEHEQYSVYNSKKPLRRTNITLLSQKLNSSLPWFKYCVKKIKVTEISIQHDLKHLFPINDLTKQKNMSIDTTKEADKSLETKEHKNSKEKTDFKKKFKEFKKTKSSKSSSTLSKKSTKER